MLSSVVLVVLEMVAFCDALEEVGGGFLDDHLSKTIHMYVHTVLLYRWLISDAR